MSGAEIMSGAKSRKWVHQKPTNQPRIVMIDVEVRQSVIGNRLPDPTFWQCMKYLLFSNKIGMFLCYFTGPFSFFVTRTDFFSR